MPLRIDQSGLADDMQRRLAAAEASMTRTTQRLSSALHTHTSESVSDAASAYAATQASSLEQAAARAAEGLKTAGSAQAGLTAASSILYSMRDVAARAANMPTEGAAAAQDQIRESLAALGRVAGVLASPEGGSNRSAWPAPIAGVAASIDPSRMGMSATGRETSAVSLADVDVTTAAGARDAVKIIDAALFKVSDQREQMGAYQKGALQNALDSLSATDRRLLDSQSAISDAEMAQDIVAQSRMSILQSTGLAMLAQANQAPQQLLQLFR